jgi:hypothetical protein
VSMFSRVDEYVRDHVGLAKVLGECRVHVSYPTGCGRCYGGG